MGDLGAEPRLVVPEGVVIDESARERLERQLALAPAATGGIGAEIRDLASGASYRVHAEWESLETPWSALVETTTAVRGAVLLRAGVGFEVEDGRVAITGGALLVDAGAHAHDPYRPIGTLQFASERGRPPFPRRPVVIFLGVDAGGDSDWVRRVVNRLVRRNVEARIAMPDAPIPDGVPGLHLTRPCLPGEATIRALAPDVVVTLDAGAAAQADAWCEGNRSTVFVELDPELADPMELVSWQIGRAAGRLRARIGPHVDVPAFAALVGRLCAGPQPVPPSDDKILVDARRPVRERWTSPASRPDCVVVTGALAGPARARVDGLVDSFAAAQIPVAAAPVAGGVPPEAREAALVVLCGVEASAPVDELIAARQRAGRPTVVDVAPDDLQRTANGGDEEPHLTDAAAALIAACGRVVAPAGARHVATRGLAARTLVLPTLFTRARAAELQAARAPVDPAAALVIGWYLDGRGVEYAGAVAEGIASALIDRRNVVQLVGDPGDLPSSLAGHERVTVVPESRLDLELLAQWTVHVWTPPLVGGAPDDDLGRFETMSYLGVPSVMPAAASTAVDGFVSSYVLVEAVERSEEWADALHHILDDAGRRERRTDEARRRADAVDSPATAKTVVNRLMGWARYPVDSSETGPS